MFRSRQQFNGPKWVDFEFGLIWSKLEMSKAKMTKFNCDGQNNTFK